MQLNCLTSTFGSISENVMAIFAIIASVFAFCAWRISIKQNEISANNLKYSILADLFTDYRSIEMGHSIRKLYGIYIRCKSKRDEWIKYYMRMYRQEKGKIDSLHDHRRRVSSFYQYMASLVENGVITKKIIYSVWKKGDLEIIPNILMPIETEALPKLMKHPLLDMDNLPEVFRNMKKLFEDAPES